MKFFKLPDLGEGLQEAEIVEWQVKAGDQVNIDQTLLVVETAKAMVEIPSPQAGTIARCFGEPGDFVYINQPLVEFAGVEDDDAGTVVGTIVNANAINSSKTRNPDTAFDQSDDEEDFFIIGAAPGDAASTAVEQADTLHGARRAMAKAIAGSQAHRSCVTLFDDADVDHWPDNTDVSVRLCQAIVAAVQRQPILNAWFDDTALTLTIHERIDLALAVDTEQGLFAPVMRDIQQRDAQSLRAGLEQLRRDVTARNIPLQELRGATLTLSNFGTLGRGNQLPRCGRYATPLVVPPSVAIIGAGDIRRQAVVTEQGIEAHRTMPLSLTFDHRVITGAEAAVFMGAMIQQLMQH